MTYDFCFPTFPARLLPCCIVREQAIELGNIPEALPSLSASSRWSLGSISLLPTSTGPTSCMSDDAEEDQWENQVWELNKAGHSIFCASFDTKSSVPCSGSFCYYIQVFWLSWYRRYGRYRLIAHALSGAELGPTIRVDFSEIALRRSNVESRSTTTTATITITCNAVQTVQTPCRHAAVHAVGITGSCFPT